MRYHKSMMAASLAVLAATALAATASAEVVNGKEVLGAKPIVVDNFKYGGNLPVGADKNVDALKVLIKAADSMGQLRDNQYGGALYLVLGDTTNAMRINADGMRYGITSRSATVLLALAANTPGVFSSQALSAAAT